MISGERLIEIVDFAESFGRHPKLDECASMAKELLAYRQAFIEPAIWANRTDVDNFADHVLSRRNQSLACTLPLYRKPNIPGQEI